MWPSTDPENTTPGMAVTAADCAGLQGMRSPQPAGGVYQTFLPLSRLNAKMPPPFLGLASVADTSPLATRVWLSKGSGIRSRSETATYTLEASAAEPHCTPPKVPPLPTRTCQSTSPC